MKEQAANFIVDTLYMGEIREDYSGRGMYGKTTFGVTVDCLSSLDNSIQEHLTEENLGDWDDLNKAIEELVEIGLITEACEDERGTFEIDGEYYTTNFRTDNMGLSYIVY